MSFNESRNEKEMSSELDVIIKTAEGKKNKKPYVEPTMTIVDDPEEMSELIKKMEAEGVTVPSSLKEKAFER